MPKAGATSLSRSAVVVAGSSLATPRRWRWRARCLVLLVDLVWGYSGPEEMIVQASLHRVHAGTQTNAPRHKTVQVA
jgi:hypothetical protein